MDDDDSGDASAHGGEGFRKRGRTISTVWIFLTDVENPHLKLSAPCKHCKESVNYHKKSEQAITHLNRCNAFKVAMMKTAVEERPKWYRSVNRKTASKAASTTQPSTTTRPIQTLITNFRVPVLSSAEKNEFKRLLALHYYNRNTPFTHVECPLLAKALRILRPDVDIPNRRNLSGDLLDNSFSDTKAKVDLLVDDPDEIVCYTSDAWSNVNRDPVVTYMGVFKEVTLFTEAVYTGQQKHDAEWITTDLKRVIDGTKAYVAGACTDNTNTNKAAWRALKVNYPAKFFYGCVCHALHLFVKDILGVKKKPRGGSAVPSYPPGFPFEAKLVLVEQCKDMVTFFRNHQVMKGLLEEKQEGAGVRKLARAAPTRWGTVRDSLKSILKSEGVLHEIVSQRDFLPGPRDQRDKRMMIFELVTSTTFVSSLRECVALLKPTDVRIKYFESDRLPLSEVYNSFVSIRAEINAVETLNDDEKAYMMALVTKRFDFIDSDAHGMSYMLDPRYLGDTLTCDEREKIEDLLVNLPPQDGSESTPDRPRQLMRELLDFNERAGKARKDKTQRFTWLEEKHKSVREYWADEGRRWPVLQKIALALFALVTSSASSERNFSTFGFVHSKLRNKLSEKNVKKLVYIKTNYNAIEATRDDLSDSYESDEGDCDL